jgi:hypothetical protein
MRRIDLSNRPPTEETLEDTVRVFFHTRANRKILLDFLYKPKTKVSLRLLDFLCTNYAHDHVCSYLVRDEPFDIRTSYLKKLEKFSKKNFDPFCRQKRIALPVFDEDAQKTRSLDTSVGQLNFFRWAIQHKVLDFARERRTDIIKSMNSKYKSKEKKRKKEAKQQILQPPPLRIRFS